MAGTQEEMELAILHAYIRAGGGLQGTVQLHQNGNLIYERVGMLSKPEELEDIAQTLTELGVTGADAELHRLMGEARAGLDDATTNGYHKPVPSRFLGQARYTIEQLDEVGRFLRTPSGGYYFNGSTRSPIDVTSKEMLFLLRQQFQVNPKDPISGYLVEELQYKVNTDGEQVEVHRFSQYDPDENVLYVDQANGRMLRVSTDAVEQVDNGSHGVLFFPTKFQQPWTYAPTDPLKWRIRRELVDSLSFVAGDDTPLRPAEQSFLFVLWLTALFFRTEMPTRPITVLVGDTGSGKSVAVRMVGRLLFGSDFELDQLVGEKEDDFWVAVTNRPFIGYDNLDTRIRWLEDALATCATGIQRSKRVLFSTNEEATYKPDTFLVLTARTPRFRRPDVAARLLFFQLASRRAQGLPNKQEKALYSQIARARNAYLSELVDRCQAVLRVPRQDPLDSPIRLADFYAVARRIALSLNLGDEVDQVMHKLRGVQHEFASEENVLVLTLLLWVERFRDGVANPNRELRAQQLFNELKDIAEANGYRWSVATPPAMGRQLGELREALEERLTIDSRHTNKGSVYRIKPAGWTDEVQLL